MSWTSASLEELCEINVGRTPARANPEFWGTGNPWLSIADMNQGRVITSTKEQITEDAAGSGRVVSPGTVLLSFKLSIGKVAMAGMPLYTNEAIAALPIKRTDRLLPEFLVRALEAQDLAGGSNRAAMGATLNKAKLKQIQIPLPPLDEQRRIAAILGRVDALRAKRRRAFAYLDDLSLSVFHSMFGSIGDSRWDQRPLGDVVSAIDNGTSPNCESRPATDDEVGILKLGAVTYGVFRAQENKAYLGEVGSMRANEVRSGDVLMTRKNTRELVGAVALVEEIRPNLLLPDLIFRLTLDETRIDRRYFQALMMNPGKRPSVRDLSSGSAASMPNISKARLRQLALELPPLDMQHKFAARVEKINSHRATMQKCVEAEEELFASVQYQAFRGDL